MFFFSGVCVFLLLMCGEAFGGIASSRYMQEQKKPDQKRHLGSIMIGLELAKQGREEAQKKKLAEFSTLVTDYSAAQKNLIEIIEQLKDQGTDFDISLAKIGIILKQHKNLVNAQDSKDKKTALHLLLDTFETSYPTDKTYKKLSFFNAVRLLLENRANAHLPDKNGVTPYVAGLIIAGKLSLETIDKKDNKLIAKYQEALAEAKNIVEILRDGQQAENDFSLLVASNKKTSKINNLHPLLAYFVLSSNVEILKNFLGMVGDLVKDLTQKKYASGKTILHYAAEEKNMSMVDVLCDALPSDEVPKTLKLTDRDQKTVENILGSDKYAQLLLQARVPRTSEDSYKKLIKMVNKALNDRYQATLATVGAILIRYPDLANRPDPDNRTALSYAAEHDKTGDMIRLLLKHGAYVTLEIIGIAQKHNNQVGLKVFDEHQSDLHKRLIDATKRLQNEKNTNYDEIKGEIAQILERYKTNDTPEEVNRADEQGRAALHYAAEYDSSGDIVKLLLENIANVSQPQGEPYKEGYTPLHKAAAASSHGNIKAMELLVEDGANVNEPLNINKIPPLWTALSGQAEDGALWLLEHGADAAFVEPSMRDNVLHAAGYDGLAVTIPSLINALKKSGKLDDFINQKNVKGLAPLHETLRGFLQSGGTRVIQSRPWLEKYLKRNRFLETIQLLLDAGADPYMPDDKGKTPLVYVEEAVKRYYPLALDERQKKAEDSKNFYLMALIEAKKIAGLLLRHTQNVTENIEEGDGNFERTLVDKTVKELKQAETFERAIEHIRPLLTYLVLGGQLEQLSTLLGATNEKVNEVIVAQDNAGRTLLHYAAMQGNVETFDLLFAKVGSATQVSELLNLQDNTKKTALQYALEKKPTAVDVVQALIEKGADTTGFDNELKKNSEIVQANKNGQITNVKLKSILSQVPEVVKKIKEIPLHETIAGMTVEAVKKYLSEVNLHDTDPQNMVLRTIIQGGGFTPSSPDAQQAERDDLVGYLVTKLVSEQTGLLNKFRKDFINFEYEKGLTPLHLAAQQPNGQKMVDALLAEKADQNKKDKSFGYTPLMYALELEHEQAALVMLHAIEYAMNDKSKPMNFDKTALAIAANNKTVPIECAAKHGLLEAYKMIEKLLPADVYELYNKDKKNEKCTLLSRAVEGANDCLKQIKSASPAAEDHIAAARRRVDVVRYLLNESVRFQAVDRADLDREKTILIASIQVRKEQLLSKLATVEASIQQQVTSVYNELEGLLGYKGIVVAATTTAGSILGGAWGYARSSFGYGQSEAPRVADSDAVSDILKILTDTSINEAKKIGGIKGVFDKKEAPKVDVVFAGLDDQTIGRILRMDVLNLRQKDTGNLCLRDAIQKDRVAVVRLLVDKLSSERGVLGALRQERDFINYLYTDDTTPLHLAAQRQNGGELVRILLDAGADATKQDADGNTPLMLAIINEHEESALALLQHADKGLLQSDQKNINDKAGFNPLQRAAQHGLWRVFDAIWSGDASINSYLKKETPLHLAVYAAHHYLQEAFGASDANIDEKISAARRQVAFVSSFLQACANQPERFNKLVDDQKYQKAKKTLGEFVKDKLQSIKENADETSKEARVRSMYGDLLRELTTDHTSTTAWLGGMFRSVSDRAVGVVSGAWSWIKQTTGYEKTRARSWWDPRGSKLDPRNWGWRTAK